MRRITTRRTEQLTLAADPDLRAAIEAESIRRESSMSSTIRALLRAQLAASASAQASPQRAA